MAKLSAVTVRPATKADLPAIGLIHMATFPDAAITLLGAEAARRYYEWQFHPGQQLVALVAVKDEAVVGFCFGGTLRGALEGFLRNNLSFIARTILLRPWLLLRAGFRRRVGLGVRVLARRVTRRGNGSGAAPTPHVADNNRSFGILAIATDPRCQRAGVGKMLMRASEAAAANLGFRRMHLSVHPSNAQAVRFYESISWRKAPGTDGSWAGVMVHEIHAPHSGATPGVPT